MRSIALLCLCLLPLVFVPPVAQAAEAADSLFHTVQYSGDPCRDGRLSDGRARTCRELKRWLRHRDRERRRWRRDHYEPCTDGRVHLGRPATCEEVRQWYYYGRDLPDWD